MTKFSSHKLQLRIAEESQLLAEEKWILKTLAKIKNERNSLQIERLQLESMKIQLNKTPTTPSTVQIEPEKSVVNIMQNSQNLNSGERIIFENQDNNDYSMQCNEEQLDLTVTNSVFDDILCQDDYTMEEDDEDESDLDMIIDINMLMNGREKRHKKK